MDEYESLSHSKWECKYHVVFIPKCRRKVLYGKLRRHLGEVLRKLAEQKECRIEEGHLLADHVHMMISIPPKYSVSSVVGFIKGKSAIHLARVYGEQSRITQGRASGHADISSRQWVAMRPRYATTFVTKSRTTNGWIN
jgi:putative transposase